MDQHNDQLSTEAFLTDFLYHYRQMERDFQPGQVGKLTTLPTWLRAVLVEMNTMANLRDGVERFARLAGRSRRHLNRLCQQHFGCSTTAFYQSPAHGASRT